MTSIPVSGEATTKLSSMQQIDAVCDAYESDLSAGIVRPLSEYVARVDKSLAHELMRELSLLDREAEELHEDSLAGKSTGPHATLTRFDVSNLRLRSDHDDCFRFENYTLLEKIGSGASGIVYLAEDIDLRKRFALKLSHADDSNEDACFIREARNSVRLDHPGIVRVLRAGSWHKTPFIVSEYVPGLNLKNWLLEHKQDLSLKQIAQLIADVADALQHAHDQKVFHRDIKPSNIVVREEVVSDPVTMENSVRLSPCIMDFGISKLDGTINSRTIQGDVIGTPAYMSPEQASGKSGEADHRADIYSLGMVLYELLSGANPFRGSTVQVLTQIQQGNITPLKISAPHVSPDLAAICHKCLDKNPAHRYATAKALADDLRLWIAGMRVSAKPISPILQLGKHWSTFNRVATCSLLVAGCIALGYGFWRSSDSDFIAKSIEQARSYERLDSDLIDYFRTGPIESLPELVQSLQEGRPGFLLSQMRELMKSKPDVIGKDYAGEMRVREYARYAYTLFLLGDHEVAWTHLRSHPDPRMRSYLIDFFADSGSYIVKQGFSIDPLFAQLQREEDAIAQYALIIALGYQAREVLADDSQIVSWIKRNYLTHSHSGVHSACLWFLARREEVNFLNEANDQLSREGMVAGRNWHVSPTGILFIHCQTPDLFYIGTTQNIESPKEMHRIAKAARKYALSAFRAPFQLQESFEETSAGPLATFSDRLHSATASSIEGMKMCAWLSQREGYLHSMNAVKEKGRRLFEVDLSQRGYRLVSDSEYEFAAEANSETDLYYGTNFTQMNQISVESKSNLLSALAIPNSFGLFELWNTTREWSCTPSHYVQSDVQKAIIDVDAGRTLVLCGINFGADREHWRRIITTGTLKYPMHFRVCQTLE